MTVDLEQLVQAESQIASFPAIVNRINEAVDDPKGNVDTIGRIITEDPALAARLLKIANSAFYNSSFPVDTVTRALTMIGTKQLKELVMATFAMQAFAVYSGKEVDMAKFWHHSIACGVVARAIATARRMMNTERFYLIGLLHDVGHLIIHTKLPEYIGPLFERCQSGKEPTFRAEQELLGFHHGSVAGGLLRAWQLPADLYQPIEMHHTPSKAEDFPMEAAIAHVAEVIAVGMGHESGIESRVPPLDPKAWEKLELTASAMPNIFRQVQVQFEVAIKIFMES